MHFSLEETGGTSVTRIGTVRDSVIDVPIPDAMLENEENDQNYKIYAFVYLAGNGSGNTEYKITIPVKARPKPEIPGTPEKPELFRETIETVNAAAEKAEMAQKQAETWAHGHAEQAKKEAASIPGRVEEGKKDIDNYVHQKETELKGETGNVHFAAFKVVKGRLKMYSDPTVDKMRFSRKRSRLKYRLKF